MAPESKSALLKLCLRSPEAGVLAIGIWIASFEANCENVSCCCDRLLLPLKVQSVFQALCSEICPNFELKGLQRTCIKHDEAQTSSSLHRNLLRSFESDGTCPYAWLWRGQVASSF